MTMTDLDDYIDDAVAAISERIESIERSGTRLENNPNRYPEKIMRCVREMYGLSEYDESRDAEINNMSHGEVFDSVCEWDGLVHYSAKIKSWIMDIYGIDLDNEGEVNTALVVPAEWEICVEPNRFDTCGNPDKYARCTHCGFQWNSIYAVRNYFKHCPNCGNEMTMKK